MTSEYAPGLLKYDVCMTEQVSGPQRTKIAGRHMVMIPYFVLPDKYIPMESFEANIRVHH